MTRRVLSAGVLAVGVAAGTLSDRMPEREPVRAGEYWVLSGDFHVHGGPGDGTLLPWELRREARRAGLDVIAITNHNSIYAARLAEWWARRFPGDPLIIAGEEITSPDYHLAAVGLQTAVGGRHSAAAAIEAVHAQGGVAIAAHPEREYWNGYDGEALSRLDGAEAANSSDPIDLADYGTFRRLALARNPDLAAIGSSDFHGWPSMGRSRTYLFVRDRSRDGVIEAIRSGRTVARDEHGHLHGPAAFVALVGPQAPAGRADPNAAWRRFAVACAWIGITGLVFFGRHGR